MNRTHLLTGALLIGLARPLCAAELSLTVQIPRHKERPYVAIWLEREDQVMARTLAVWHEGGRPSKKGKKKRDKYLKDLHVWWRAGGRDQEMPIDGVSGATRAAGSHTLHFRADQAPLDRLPAGNYQLLVEAAREDGDQELIRLPLAWPPEHAQSASEEGRYELTRVTLDLAP